MERKAEEAQLVGSSSEWLPGQSRATLELHRTILSAYMRPPYTVASPLLFVRVFSCIGYEIQNLWLLAFCSWSLCALGYASQSGRLVVLSIH